MAHLGVQGALRAGGNRPTEALGWDLGRPQPSDTQWDWLTETHRTTSVHTSEKLKALFAALTKGDNTTPRGTKRWSPW